MDQHMLHINTNKLHPGARDTFVLVLMLCLHRLYAAQRLTYFYNRAVILRKVDQEAILLKVALATHPKAGHRVMLLKADNLTAMPHPHQPTLNRFRHTNKCY